MEIEPMHECIVEMGFVTNGHGNITIDKPCLVVQQKGLTMWIMEDVALGLLPGPSWRREDL